MSDSAAVHVTTDPACVFFEVPRPGSRVDRDSRGVSCAPCMTHPRGRMVMPNGDILTFNRDYPRPAYDITDKRGVFQGHIYPHNVAAEYPPPETGHVHAYVHTGTVKIFACRCGNGHADITHEPVGEGIAGLPPTATSPTVEAIALIEAELLGDVRYGTFVTNDQTLTGWEIRQKLWMLYDEAVERGT